MQEHWAFLTVKALSHFEPTVATAKSIATLKGHKVTVLHQYDPKFESIIDATEGSVNFYLLPSSEIEDGHDLEIESLGHHIVEAVTAVNPTTLVFEMFTCIQFEKTLHLNIPHYVYLTVGSVPAQYMFGYIHSRPDKCKIQIPSTVLEKVIEFAPHHSQLLQDNAEEIEKDDFEVTKLDNSSKVANYILNDINIVAVLNSHFRGGYIPETSNEAKHFYAFNEYKMMMKAMESAKGVLLNSFAGFKTELPFVPDGLHEKFNYIGPSALFHDKSMTPTTKRPQVLKWLDEQNQNSVLYVATGSIWKMKDEEIRELYDALMKLDIPFLWSLQECQHSKLPHNIFFDSESEISPTQKQVVMKWVPQKEVLNHPATSAFLSHCGWNSLIETLIAGKPLIAWPIFAEQYINALTIVAKEIGILVDGTGLRSTKVLKSADIIKHLKDFKANEARFQKNVKVFSESARKSVTETGESYKAIIKL